MDSISLNKSGKRYDPDLRSTKPPIYNPPQHTTYLKDKTLGRPPKDYYLNLDYSKRISPSGSNDYEDYSSLTPSSMRYNSQRKNSGKSK